MAMSELRPITRFITGHDQTGSEIFANSTAEQVTAQTLPDGVKFFLGYTTSEYPVQMKDDRDIAQYENFLKEPPGLVVSNGTVLRVVDMPPGAVSPMHRTVSLDYGVVLDGEVELVLNSGESRRMRRGDIAIQRGTNHAWKNLSKSEWARMLYVLQPSKPLSIGGKTLEEDRGSMVGVKASD